MYRSSVSVALFFVALYPISAQVLSVPDDDRSQEAITVPQFGEPLSSTSFLQFSLSSPPIGAAMSTVTGGMVAGYRGIMMAGLEHDYVVIDPFQRTDPQDIMFFHLPLYRQHGAIPTMFIEGRSMIKDCKGEFPKENVSREFLEKTGSQLFGTDFRLHTGSIAVGMTTVSHEHLTVTGGLGVQFLSWHQGETYYTVDMQDRYRRRDAGDWQRRPVGFARLSAVAALSERLDLNVDLRTFPIFDMRRSDFAIISWVGHSRTLALSYHLFPEFRFNIADQFVGGYGGHWYDHFFRLSVTAGILTQ